MRMSTAEFSACFALMKGLGGEVIRGCFAVAGEPAIGPHLHPDRER